MKKPHITCIYAYIHWNTCYSLLHMVSNIQPSDNCFCVMIIAVYIKAAYVKSLVTERDRDQHLKSDSIPNK